MVWQFLEQKYPHPCQCLMLVVFLMPAVPQVCSVSLWVSWVAPRQLLMLNICSLLSCHLFILLGEISVQIFYPSFTQYSFCFFNFLLNFVSSLCISDIYLSNVTWNYLLLVHSLTFHLNKTSNRRRVLHFTFNLDPHSVKFEMWRLGQHLFFTLRCSGVPAPRRIKADLPSPNCFYAHVDPHVCLIIILLVTIVLWQILNQVVWLFQFHYSFSKLF